MRTIYFYCDSFLIKWFGNGLSMSNVDEIFVQCFLSYNPEVIKSVAIWNSLYSIYSLCVGAIDRLATEERVC